MATLRPSACSRLITATFSAGKTSASLTVDTYGHLVPGANRKAVDRLDDEGDMSGRNPGATDNETA